MTNNSIISEIITLTKKEKDYFFPLKIIKINLIDNNRQFKLKPDCEIVLNYKNRKGKFLVKVKSNTSLKSIQEEIVILKNFNIRKNENLMLDNTTRADSIPSLEIDANDVRASHGATIGKIVE